MQDCNYIHFAYYPHHWCDVILFGRCVACGFASLLVWIGIMLYAYLYSTTIIADFLKVYYFFVQLITFGSIFEDRIARNEENGQRISEDLILLFVFLGGSPGGVFAMLYLDHKTHNYFFLTEYIYMSVGSLLIAVLLFLSCTQSFLSVYNFSNFLTNVMFNFLIKR